MASFVPDTDPDVLAWARKVMRMPREIAAKKVGVDAIVLREWEEGVGGPTFAQLREMARVYKKPVATLLRSSIPKGEDPIPEDFRLLPQNQRRELTTELVGALWRVDLQRDVTRRLAEARDAVPEPLSLSLHLTMDPEMAGEDVRSWLGIPASSPADPYRRHDLNQWIELIEAKSILVVQVSLVALEEMRGCSVSDQPFPAIVLNGSDTPRGKVFTLMHELVHILLHNGGLCDLEDKRTEGTSPKARIERFCNEVAATILMPRPILLRDWRVATALPTTRWTDQDLRSLAANFGVSQEALLLRLVSIGRAPRALYQDLQPHYQRAYEDLRQTQQDTGFIRYYQRKIRDFGRPYINTVLDAYYRDDITSLEVADYLDMKLNNLSTLEERLGVRR
jgi:Zn-dependent peptidase ImmA (M78 family)